MTQPDRTDPGGQRRAPAAAPGVLAVNLGDVLVAAGAIKAFVVIANPAWEAYRKGHNGRDEVGYGCA